MTRILIAAALAASAWAFAQSCPVPIPPRPPKAALLAVQFLNPDGGARPCAGAATVPGGVEPKLHPISNARCDVAKDIADQFAAIDNGWDDGGTR